MFLFISGCIPKTNPPTQGNTPVFVDHFENETNNENQYTSTFYGETIDSIRNISFVNGKVEKGVHLDALNSYICYSTQYLNPTEGTIKFYFKPNSDYQLTYYDSTTMNNRFEAFLLDTVGWLEAFSGGFSNVMLFGVDQNTQEKIINMIFGTWSGYSWSYAIAESITLPTDQFTEIAVIWNKTEGKIKLYLNGIKVAENDYNTDLNNGELFFIGQNPFGQKYYGMAYWPYGPHAMMGTYDELEIYDVDIYKLPG
ncbi:MAG: hypothetical protein C0196_03455 [Dictyoglomus turgidum]|nr:MAG: hypothetical protein C0196_03455 [Dictyoglomus turgidum]